ncbi:Two-component signal transduction system YycFG, regulatory protein YycH [Thermoactinomyces sp. DSM 45891]|uniref:two-component system activity regulator YycH n=1 Tax=Thermoactinomyces sp. DSM 45891 TaxID=1761907 RepID=UPI0009154F88|nr:two-component system activity regulator YycH [Thermoactinomyces sp. DSM 45891]SFX30397.1 Two-component signal transduction system YycFG, regulatory protein YycH [Thermoactinomyces sp. DSM 45891]
MKKPYWKKYKEPIKTTLLISLVVLSIWQTAFYWLSSAFSTEITENHYQTIPKFGEKEFNEKETYQLSAPPITYLHDQSVIRFLPATLSTSEIGLNPYQKLIQQISQSSLGTAQSVELNTDDWKKILMQPGVEFQYHSAVPLEQVGSFLNWKSTPPSLSVREVDRVWMTLPNEQETAVLYLISSRSQDPQVYQVSTTLSKNEFFKLIQGAKPHTLYQATSNFDPSSSGPVLPKGNLYYLPDQPVKVDKVTYPITPIAVEEVKKVLFEDPNLQPLKPREGWEIYAHGTRQTLFYDKLKNEIQYNKQLPESEDSPSKTEPKVLVGKMNDFLKRHFGWTGDFHLEHLSSENNEMKFRQFDSGIPIYWKGQSDPFLPEVSPVSIRTEPYISNSNMEDARVYHRSLDIWKPTDRKAQSVTLPDKDMLKDTFQKYKVDLSSIKQIQLVYLADRGNGSNKNTVTLIPYWKVVVMEGSGFPMKENTFYVGGDGQWIGEKQKQF